MRRIITALVTLFAVLLLNPVYNQAQRTDSIIKSKVSLGIISPELREAYKRMRYLGFMMSEATNELQDNVEKLLHSQKWQAKDVSNFYYSFNETISKVEKLDIDARKAFLEYEKQLVSSALPGDAVKNHQNFVQQYYTNYSKLKNISEKILSVRSNIISIRNGAPVLKVNHERDNNARIELKNGLVELKKILGEWDSASRGKDVKENRGKELPDPWLNIIMKKRVPKTSKNNKTNKIANAIFTTPLSDEYTIQTVETEMNEELTNLVATLEYDPIKIYEWVHNNIAYQPYYGSAKGAAKTYFDRAGNDFDTASLLMALLREKSIDESENVLGGTACRYVYGTVKLTSEQANNMFGTDYIEIAEMIFSSRGIPATWTGQYFLIEHCWVEAYVPYDNYLGTKDKSGGETWIPLDPSFKQYSYSEGLDISKEVTFDWKSFFENGITEKTAVEIYKDNIENYVNSNYAGKTIDDVPIKRTIVSEHLEHLPASLPYIIDTEEWKYAEIPSAYRHLVRFSMLTSYYNDEPTAFDTGEIPTAEIYAKRTTIMWVGAEQIDQDLIDSFGGIFNTPSSMIKVKPVFMLGDQVRASGDPVSIGVKLFLQRELVLPQGIETSSFQSMKYPISAGEVAAVANVFQGYSDEYVQKQFEILRNNKDSLDYNDIFGQIAYINATYYYSKVNKSDLNAAALRHFIAISNQPSYGLMTIKNRTSNFFGALVGIAPGTFITDAINLQTLTPLHIGNIDSEYSKLIGCTDSQLEGFTYRDLYGMPPVSAVTMIQHAYTQDGAQVTNGWTDDNTQTKDILATSISYYDWHGSVWIVTNPSDFGPSYMPGYIIYGDMETPAHGGSAAAWLGASFKNVTGNGYYYVQAAPELAKITGIVYSMIPELRLIGSSESQTDGYFTAALYEEGTGGSGCEYNGQARYNTEGCWINRTLFPSSHIAYPYIGANNNEDWSQARFSLGEINAGQTRLLKTNFNFIYPLIEEVTGSDYGPEVALHAVGPKTPEVEIFTDSGTGNGTPDAGGNVFIPFDEKDAWSFTGGTVTQVWKDGEPFAFNPNIDILTQITETGEYLIYYTDSTGTHWVKVWVAELSSPTEAIFTIGGIVSPTDENGYFGIGADEIPDWGMNDGYSLISIIDENNDVFTELSILPEMGGYFVYYKDPDGNIKRVLVYIGTPLPGCTLDSSAVSGNSSQGGIDKTGVIPCTGNAFKYDYDGDTTPNTQVYGVSIVAKFYLPLDEIKVAQTDFLWAFQYNTITSFTKITTLGSIVPLKNGINNITTLNELRNLIYTNVLGSGTYCCFFNDGTTKYLIRLIIEPRVMFSKYIYGTGADEHHAFYDITEKQELMDTPNHLIPDNNAKIWVKKAAFLRNGNTIKVQYKSAPGLANLRVWVTNTSYFNTLNEHPSVDFTLTETTTAGTYEGQFTVSNLVTSNSTNRMHIENEDRLEVSLQAFTLANRKPYRFNHYVEIDIAEVSTGEACFTPQTATLDNANYGTVSAPARYTADHPGYNFLRYTKDALAFNTDFSDTSANRMNFISPTTNTDDSYKLLENTNTLADSQQTDWQNWLEGRQTNNFNDSIAGNSDILYLSVHGIGGKIYGGWDNEGESYFRFGTINFPAPVVTPFHPMVDFHKKLDLEWIIIAGCSTLRDFRAGQWANTLLPGLAGGIPVENPIHGIIGYRSIARGAPYDINIAQGFEQMVRGDATTEGQTIKDAWHNASLSIASAAITNTYNPLNIYNGSRGLVRISSPLNTGIIVRDNNINDGIFPYRMTNNTILNDNNSTTYESSYYDYEVEYNCTEGRYVITNFATNTETNANPNFQAISASDVINSWEYYLRDVDGDGYGNINVRENGCENHNGTLRNIIVVPQGYVAPDGYDCDDTNPAINPSANEILGNAIDENCNGSLTD